MKIKDKFSEQKLQPSTVGTEAFHFFSKNVFYSVKCYIFNFEMRLVPGTAQNLWEAYSTLHTPRGTRRKGVRKSRTRGMERKRRSVKGKGKKGVMLRHGLEARNITNLNTRIQSESTLFVIIIIRYRK